jgi:hypothetical protein
MPFTWRPAFVAALVTLMAALLGCSERFEWREVRADEGFVALLPGRPQVVTRDIDIGGQRGAMTIWSTGSGPAMFAVGTVRLPPAAMADATARDMAVAQFRDGLVRNIGSAHATPLTLPPLATGARKPLADEAFEAVGRPGADGRKSRLAARVFIVDDRLFQLVTLGAEGEIPPEARDTFFTSFRLTP